MTERRPLVPTARRAFRDVRSRRGSPAARAMLFVLLAPLVFPGPVLFGRLNSRDDVGHSGFRP
ncbi:hypothetical protein [Streptomyces sp. TRM68416]|uniref:hypothetical protein n=1 Tax=Streptomyces sp. TRM68416 TaxID=2758412 RepID=UPI001CB7386D|nr:hypothetical protein [Streptomyces sp. TRM68416]